MTDPLMHAARLRAYSDILIEYGRDEEAAGLRETADAIEASVDIPGVPIRLSPPHDWQMNLNRPRPEEFFDRNGQLYFVSSGGGGMTCSGRFRWPDGTAIEATATQVIEHTALDRRIDLILPVGGRQFLMPLEFRRTTWPHPDPR